MALRPDRSPMREEPTVTNWTFAQDAAVEHTTAPNGHPPSLHWLSEGDWVRFMGIVIWLLLSFMAVAFCVTALVAFTRGEIGTAIVMALLGAVLRPQYGWRG